MQRLFQKNRSHQSGLKTSVIFFPQPLFIAVIAGAYLSVGALSLIGNLIVILVLVVMKRTRTVTNIFISSVSAADLVSCH